MKKLVVNVEDEKFDFINELLSNFSFVKVDKDWYDSLTKIQKASIEGGLNDIENGNILSHEYLQDEVKQRIMILKDF